MFEDGTYSGTIPLGNVGLVTDLSPSSIPSGALIRANNIVFNTGNLEKAPGDRRYNTTPLPAGIVALYDWEPIIPFRRLIAVTSAGSVYRDIGDKVFSGNVAIKTGLGSLTPNIMFVEGGIETAGRSKKLFLFTGINPVQVLTADATTMADLATPAADWTGPNYPKYGIQHRARLWAFGNDNAPQRVYASTTGDHEDFAGGSALSFNVFPGEGGRLVGGFVYKGLFFVFKEGGFVYYLDDSDTDTSNWFFKKSASTFDLASPHGVTPALDDLLVASSSGSITSLVATQAFGNVASADILSNANIAEYVRTSTSLAGVPYMHSIYYEAKKQVFFTYRSKYQTYNDRLLMIDLNRRDSPRFSLYSKNEADCLATLRDINGVKRVIYGDRNGYVYVMDQEDRLVHSSAYTGEFKTAHTDFRDLDQNLAQRMKNFAHLAVEFVPQGMWDLEVDVYIDGTLSETINFAMDVRDDGLDTFTLDTDPLGREETQTIVKPLVGSGRRISFHCKQSGSNQNFQIASLTVYFTVSDEGIAGVS